MAEHRKREQTNTGMEADRAERTPGAGVHGDRTAGDEGIDDAMSRTQRDDMSATPMHGDELSGSSPERSSSESGTQQEQSQRSQRTNKRANDEEFDNAREFSGQGEQKEGSEHAEGTGYTHDQSKKPKESNTDESSRGNPLT